MHDRPVPPNGPDGPDAQESRVSEMANRLVMGIARHWLALINLAIAFFLFIPFVAPWLYNNGVIGPAAAIYFVYGFSCHQLPDHSYFLFGAEPLYTVQALEMGGMPEGLDLLERRRFVGSDSLGFKIAICQRDIAIYGSLLLGGMLFGALRRRLPTLTWRYYILFLIPIALDGGTQLIGLRQSNWWLRTVTGAIFGLASVWLVYPVIQAAMDDVLETQQQILHK
jgi:uncharacterized membrane protein